MKILLYIIIMLCVLGTSAAQTYNGCDDENRKYYFFNTEEFSYSELELYYSSIPKLADNSLPLKICVDKASFDEYMRGETTCDGSSITGNDIKAILDDCAAQINYVCGTKQLLRILDNCDDDPSTIKISAVNYAKWFNDNGFSSRTSAAASFSPVNKPGSSLYRVGKS